MKIILFYLLGFIIGYYFQKYMIIKHGTIKNYIWREEDISTGLVMNFICWWFVIPVLIIMIICGIINYILKLTKLDKIKIKFNLFKIIYKYL
jgi:hypothetical protein